MILALPCIPKAPSKNLYCSPTIPRYDWILTEGYNGILSLFTPFTFQPSIYVISLLCLHLHKANYVTTGQNITVAVRHYLSLP